MLTFKYRLKAEKESDNKRQRKYRGRNDLENVKKEERTTQLSRERGKND
jgi:hypothetical protein